MNSTAKISQAKAHELVVRACLASGAGHALAVSLADATLSAARFGPSDLGFPHLMDYLDALKAGRINGHPRPVIQHILPSVLHVDADRGIAQLPFDLAYQDFCKCVTTFGVAIYSQRNSYTVGELGYYVRRLADDGIVSIAAANGPALMTTIDSGKRVYCTNPLAFGAPTGDLPVIVDQASSATAFIRIRQAAELGLDIPEGWAVDRSGQSTTSAREAVEGALLPFGGYKGANIALMVEILSAGLSGASWSIDGPSFLEGNRSPDAGMTIMAIAPPGGSGDFSERIAEGVRKLTSAGVHIPSKKFRENDIDQVDIPEELLANIKTIAGVDAVQPT